MPMPSSISLECKVRGQSTEKEWPGIDIAVTIHVHLDVSTMFMLEISAYVSCIEKNLAFFYIRV